MPQLRVTLIDDSGTEKYFGCTVLHFSLRAEILDALAHVLENAVEESAEREAMRRREFSDLDLAETGPRRRREEENLLDD